ncbi:hypothetical protein Y1Q_0000211 [Alligator mississippiensis]|uniref:Uncharacterized protein n=1 Tax=Alligator mississippiensis TaxID=8496 RepID=A0A151MP17_ALLMI|nr:hypothetical protein Y1Q_0000211 [Alligator mississippiensis]
MQHQEFRRGPRGCRIAWWVLFLIPMVPSAERSVICNGSCVVVPTFELRSSAGSLSCPCVLVLLLLLFYMITCCI